MPPAAGCCLLKAMSAWPGGTFLAARCGGFHSHLTVGGPPGRSSRVVVFPRFPAGDGLPPWFLPRVAAGVEAVGTPTPQTRCARSIAAGPLVGAKTRRHRPGSGRRTGAGGKPGSSTAVVRAAALVRGIWSPRRAHRPRGAAAPSVHVVALVGTTGRRRDHPVVRHRASGSGQDGHRVQCR